MRAPAPLEEARKIVREVGAEALGAVVREEQRLPSCSHTLQP
jgi:hypothetical protein